MAKIRQSFTRKQVEYKYDEKTNKLVELDERTNLQELINSHYDETLYYNLERYFAENVSVLPPSDDSIADDIELEGTKADRMLTALQRVQDLRIKYAIPDYYSDLEVLRFLREKAAAINNPTNAEGGDTDEKTPEQTSESEELS